ncbi:MAG: NAD(P)-dependent oxidoreductase [Hyphomicrobiaceae bacterium]
MPHPVIGFIGLGLMGAGATRRLCGLGHRVVGYDIRPGQIAAAAAWGVEAATSPADVARSSDIVLASLTTTAALTSVIEGADGLTSAGAARARVLVDLSTCEIAETKRLAAVLASVTAMDFIDAPVSGGPGAAETGTLAIMAGGDGTAITAVRPVMEQLGRFTHMGAVGAGQATKLVNQALVLTNYCVIAEALRLAEAYGIDAAKVPEALATGHAGSNLLPVLFERMIARDFAPRGYARQVLKDLEMLNDAAHDKKLALPMAGQALTLYRLLNAQGKSEQDGTAILTLWPERDET